MLGLVARLEPLLPPLLALLDVPVEDGRPGKALAQPQRRQLTLDAVKRLLLRESQVAAAARGPSGLHWIE